MSDTDFIDAEKNKVIGGTLYSVGHTIVLHAGYGKYYLVIYSIEGLD